MLLLKHYCWILLCLEENFIKLFCCKLAHYICCALNPSYAQQVRHHLKLMRPT
jgi:hypothetical protein